MTLLQNVKPFWPLLFTFILPRAIGYYQALKTAYRTRPPPKPLSGKASRSINIFFVAILIFFWLSFTLSSNDVPSNIFAQTQTRLQVPTDVLFSRLAAKRKTGLTPLDEALKAKLTTLPLRQLYLRYGPHTIADCVFCHPDDPLTYALHYLPSNILAPHIFNILAIGLATSRSICGPSPSQFRLKATLGAIALLFLDIYIITSFEYQIDPNMPSPPSLYANAAAIRPLILCLFDACLAFLIYASATGRFIFFPFLASASTAESADPEEMMQRTQKLLAETNTALAMTQMKLRGLNVTKNAVVRDEVLKGAENRYWETVRRMEAEDGMAGGLDDTVFEDEEVQAALARAFGSGNVDVGRMKKEAEGFVREVTRGLDQGPES